MDASEYIDEKALRPALQALERQNAKLKGLFDHLDFNRIGGSGAASGAAKLADQRLKLLIAHFGGIRLRTEDFEFPDLIGAAYEYLIKEFADTAGRKGGEFYTPRAVVRMMVELLAPTENMRIYDPCVGSGGMLIHAAEYVEEHGGDTSSMFFAGQDANSGSWISAPALQRGSVQDGSVNHGVRTASLVPMRCSDASGVCEHHAALAAATSRARRASSRTGRAVGWRRSSVFIVRKWSSPRFDETCSYSSRKRDQLSQAASRWPTRSWRCASRA